MKLEALSGLTVPYSGGMIIEAGKIVVVSAEAGVPYALPDANFGFLFCEAVLVFAG